MTTACPNCGAPVVEGRCSSVTCQNHNGTSAASTPLVVVEALRLADRIEKGYPEVWLREKSQDALVQLARFVREELKLDA